MALRIIESQVIGRVLRWSASPAWVAARGLLSQEECFAFLLTKCEEDPRNSCQPISPVDLGLTEWQAYPSAYQLALHLSVICRFEESACLLHVPNEDVQRDRSKKPPATSVLTGLQTKYDPLTITFRAPSSQQSFTPLAVHPSRA